MWVVLPGSNSENVSIVMNSDKKSFYHSNNRGCSDIEELANRIN